MTNQENALPAMAAVPVPVNVPVEKQRCGFIALLGAPNAGKSTLMNAITGNKVSIVSPKPQTTRARVMGIAMADEAQLVFVDLPGVFAPRRTLDQAMVDVAWEGARTADVVLAMVDASRERLAKETQAVVAWLKDQQRQAILVLNKVDVADKNTLLKLAKELFDTGVFSEVLMISASTGDGVADLQKLVASRVPQGAWHYDPEQLTDLPERMWAAEITREQAFLQLHQEVPYAITVETESWKERGRGAVVISQVIYVQRANQRAIVLGKGGARIREIGMQARLEMEKELERKVHLTLHVKIKEDWAEDPRFLREQGLME